MQIQSSRFGRLDVSHTDMLLMPQGLIGFETCRHWILLSNPENEEVAWLQSVALANVALPVISPRRFVPNYRAHIQRRDLDVLRIKNADQVYLLCVVSKSGGTLTSNLKSPIILNATQRLATQVVVTDDQPLSLPLGLTGTESIRRAA